MHRKLLAELARQAPLLPGADEVAFVDIDPTHKRVYGRAKQGAQIGRFKGVRTLHPLLATISTPIARPVVAGGAVASGQVRRCAGRGPVRRRNPGHRHRNRRHRHGDRAPGLEVLHGEVVAARRRHGAHFSPSTRMNPSIAAAITSIPETPWTPIRYLQAFEDPDTGELISEADLAELGYTAFTGRPQALQATARLIVRRVMDRAKPATRGERGEWFPVYRYHPVFTDSPFATVTTEADHRRHATIEQVIADGKAGPLAHLPSGAFHANAAWMILWVMAHNLLRASGCLASVFHTKATTATLRAHLIHVPGRLAPLRPPHHGPPARTLALASSLAATLRRHPPRPTSPRRLTTPCSRSPSSADRDQRPPGHRTTRPQWTPRPLRQGDATRPLPPTRQAKINNIFQEMITIVDRWIRA